MYNVICTCGTSLLTNISKERNKENSLIGYHFYKVYKETKDVDEALTKTCEYFMNTETENLLNDLQNEVFTCFESICSKNKKSKKLTQVESTIRRTLTKDLIIKLNFITYEEYVNYIYNSHKKFIESEEFSKEDFTRKLNSYFSLDIKNFIRSMSAECNAMAFYLDETFGKTGVKDKLGKVFLILTDTKEGSESAEIIKSFTDTLLKVVYKVDTNNLFEIEQIKGLTVKGKDEFKNRGVKEYLKYLFYIRYKDTKNEHKYVINFTGGFKAIIPYTVYFASIFDLDMFYIYERENYGIVFPKIPIKLESIYDDLKEIKEKSMNEKSKGVARTYAFEKNMGSFIDFKTGEFNAFGDVLIELIEKKISKENKHEFKLVKDTKKNQNNFLKKLHRTVCRRLCGK